MERFDAVAAHAQRFGEFVHFVAGAREDDGEFRVFKVENAAERCGAVVARNHIGDLRHSGRFSLRRFLAGDGNAFGILKVFVGNLGNPRGKRGGEERRLDVARKRFEDGVKLIGEAEVEHFVRFVEHDGLDAFEMQRAAVDVVEGASRRGDHNVSAALERANLTAVFLSAVDGRNHDSGIAAVAVEGFGDLEAELAGRRENENDGFARFMPERPALDQGERKGRGFARAGSGLAENVRTLEDCRNGGFLNGRGFFKAEGGKRGDELGREAEFGKCSHDF